MSRKKNLIVCMVLGALLSFSAFAAEDVPLSASDRVAILQTLVAKMNANYIEPAVAERAGKAIVKKNADGGYASVASAQAFSEALAKDLREFSGDLHFGAWLDERFRERSNANDVPSSAEMDQMRDETLRRGL